MVGAARTAARVGVIALVVPSLRRRTTARPVQCRAAAVCSFRR